MLHQCAKYEIILCPFGRTIILTKACPAQKPLICCVSAPWHGLPQIIIVDPNGISVWHAMVHQCAKYEVILPLHATDARGRRVFARNSRSKLPGAYLHAEERPNLVDR